jgi:DNA modification methylase
MSIVVNKIYCGNTIDVLKTFPDESINCCITSPPYWALRDYGTDGVVWDGDADCEHEFELEESKNPADQGGKGEKDNGKYGDWEGTTNKHRKGFCNKCGAWKGQLGLEPDFNLYIKHLCDIFDEVKRVLRKDGTCWVNLGDTYGGNNSRGSNGGRAGFGNEREGVFVRFESKNLCNIPSRFSIEMQNRGWILRNKIIWHKPNCMPSSVTDRFTVDFEEIFFFVKNKKYWFEQQLVPYDAPMNRWGGESLKRDTSKTKEYKDIQKIGHSSAFRVGRPMRPNEQGKNMRTVWKIPTQPFPDAHFAVFPEKLVETPIKAGCPKEICTKCGKPREKIIAKKEYIVDEKEPSNKFKDATVNSAGGRAFITTIQRKYTPNQKDVALYLKSKIKDKALLDEEFGQHTWTHWVRTDESGASLPNPEQYLILKDMLELDGRFDKEMLTTVTIVSDDKGGKTEVIGYTKCDCDAPFVAGIVLDPFMGSGTTAVFCEKNHYQWLGCEVSDKYCEMIKGRLEPYKMQKRLI